MTTIQTRDKSGGNLTYAPNAKYNLINTLCSIIAAILLEHQVKKRAMNKLLLK